MGDFFNPPSSQVPAPQLNQFQLPDIGGAATESLGQLAGIKGQYVPAAWANYNTVAGNPWANAATTGAATAMGLGQGQALGQLGWGNLVSGGGASLYPYAQQIWNTAADPQRDLYARTLRDVTEQTRAGQAARGILTSPYGAGVENKALSDFNIDWNKQMLDRMVAGGNAAGSLTGQAGNAIAQGQGLSAAAPGQYFQASGYPYQTVTGQGNASLDALTKAYGIPAGLAQQYLGYTGQGMTGIGNLNTAQNALYKNQLTGANDSFNQQMKMFDQAGKAIGFGMPYMQNLPLPSFNFGGGNTPMGYGAPF